jgi:DNA replication protein DnaC
VIGEVAEKVLTNIADSAGSLPDDYIGSDGLLYCGQCNTRKEREIIWFDGKPKKVPVMCKCRAEEERLKKEQMQKEEEMRSIQRAKISSMMDDTFRTACFANYQIRNGNERHLKVAKKYCIEFSKMYERNQGLLFWGTVGTGKSYTAACIANYLLEANTSVVMTSFVRILQEMQGFDREREETFTNKLNSVKLLIIDDLGAERSTDYALEKVYGIIDNRYRAKKPLILTTNLTLQQMQEATDIRYARIYDRIFEMCYPMEFSGVSWRKREAAQRYEETRKILEG